MSKGQFNQVQIRKSYQLYTIFLIILRLARVSTLFPRLLSPTPWPRGLASIQISQSLDTIFTHYDFTRFLFNFFDCCCFDAKLKTELDSNNRVCYKRVSGLMPSSGKITTQKRKFLLFSDYSTSCFLSIIIFQQKLIAVHGLQDLNKK